MVNRLAKYFAFTILASFLVTGLAFSIWFHRKSHGMEEGQALGLLMVLGNIFQHLVLAISFLPVFLLKDKHLYGQKMYRLLLYFGGPFFVTASFALFAGNSMNDKLMFLIPGLSFMLLQFFFYRRLVTMYNPEAY